MPLISIVIPTRNRAHLLRYAIQSALGQKFHDFEVVVSDNSSSDNTCEVVSEFADERLRYIRTDRVMHMPDSWEFALSHAHGEYITYLSDDDAIHPHLLSKAWQVLQSTNSDVAVWPFGAIYYHRTCLDSKKINCLELAHYTGSVSIIDSASILKRLYDGEFTHHLPRMINSLCSKKILLGLCQELGRLFFPIAPDYTSGIAILSQVKTVTYIDDLLLIWGIGKESIGASSSVGGEAGQTFLEEFKDEKSDLFKYTPLKSMTVQNIVVNSILKMEDVAGISGFQINWTSYFNSIYQELTLLEKSGSDISKQLEQFFQALELQPEQLRRDVEKKIKTHDYNLQRQNSPFRKMIRKMIGNGYFRNAIDNMRKQNKLLTIKGLDHGFSNIFECSQNIDKIMAVTSKDHSINTSKS